MTKRKGKPMNYRDNYEVFGVDVDARRGISGIMVLMCGKRIGTRTETDKHIHYGERTPAGDQYRTATDREVDFIDFLTEQTNSHDPELHHVPHHEDRDEVWHYLGFNEAGPNYEDCEHGLSADLCCGPTHYPPDM